MSDAVAAELAVLEQHPEYERAMKHTPRSSTAVIVALGIALTGGGGILGVVAPTVTIRTIGWCLALVGVACMAVAVFFTATPLERVLALVIANGGEQKHYVVIARIDGEKREYRASEPLAARLKPGDRGLAYLKAGFLRDFHSLR